MIPKTYLISDNCTNRIKPSLLRDVKTEALLVFARTALERYFAQVDESSIELKLSTNEETRYTYDTLKKLLMHLQESVVNVDYLINLIQNAKKYPALKVLAKKEESLISYYDIMAKKVRSYYKEEPASLPELLVICVLAEWILGEEKSTNLYPFLKEIDFLELMGSFENNRKAFEREGKCKVSEIHELSFVIVEKLKRYKFKVNTTRVSKTRK